MGKKMDIKNKYMAGCVVERLTIADVSMTDRDILGIGQQADSPSIMVVHW